MMNTCVQELILPYNNFGHQSSSSLCQHYHHCFDTNVEQEGGELLMSSEVLADMNILLMQVQEQQPQEDEEGHSILKIEPGLFYEKKRKRIDHNNKEKLRRIKINDSYCTLLSLLPDRYQHSSRSKRRWSAPMVVNKVLDYIPELQKEVEKLKQRKDSMLLAMEKKKHIAYSKSAFSSSTNPTPTVSVTEANKGEVIVQICLHAHQQSDLISNLLSSIEHEGISVDNASSLLLCSLTFSYNLHLHINKSFHTAHYAGVLREKILSWLCEKNTSSFSISDYTQTFKCQ